MTSRAKTSLALALLLAVSAVSVSGCSSIKKLTGQRNDTVLPGQREDILPPEQTRAQDPSVLQKDTATAPGGSPAGGTDTIPCDPSAQDCSSGVDQEAGGFEG